MPDEAVDLFLQRLHALLGMLETSDGLSKEAKDALVRVLVDVIEVREAYPEVLGTGFKGERSFVDSADIYLGDIPRAARTGKNAFSAARDIAKKLIRALDPYVSGSWASDRGSERAEVLRVFHDRAIGTLQALAMAEELESFRSASELIERASVAVSQAEGARDAAQEAAGVTGGATLSVYFESYATAELRSANVFRGLTILAIAGAIAAALFLPHPPIEDWPGVVYRLAVVAGVAALGAYFGRQAGQHRVIYNWAKSIQVQLQSFPAFVETLDTKAHDDIYESFARRVLGGPPERSSKNSDDSAEIPQLIQLISSLVKRIP